MGERIQFERYSDARSHARDHLSHSQPFIGENLYSGDFPQPDEMLAADFFALQSEVEAEGYMNYQVYAQRLWKSFYGEVETEVDLRAYDEFEHRLISGLHNIEMKDLVYSHVLENLEALLERRIPQMRGLALWSTGDVAATGYQAGKIDKSGIIQSFLRALIKKHPDQAREIAGMTSYMVDDDKFERLADFLEEKAEGDHTKIVIIEDSVKNFGKVTSELKARFGPESNQFEVVPIWATYSREGQNARRRAEESPEAFEEFRRQCEDLNAIISFEELLGSRFDGIFEDAYVFVDFDGVIGDNVGMRKEQARVKYEALIEGGLKKGLTLDEINNRIHLRLGQKP